MSLNRKLFVAVTVLVAVVVSTFGAVDYTRKAKRRSTAEHWLRLLSGSNQSNQAQPATGLVQVGAPVEIVGSTGYSLYNN